MTGLKFQEKHHKMTVFIACCETSRAGMSIRDKLKTYISTPGRDDEQISCEQRYWNRDGHDHGIVDSCG